MSSLSENIKRVVDEILWAIRDYSEETRARIEQDVKKYIFYEGLDLSDIQRKVLKSYGIDVDRGVEKKISELRLVGIPITIIGKIISINEKEIETAYGKGKKYYGIIADETGTIPFNSWKMPQQIKRGDVIKIERAFVREFAGKLQLYIGHNSNITVLPPNSIVLHHPEKKYKFYKIIDLRPGIRNVEVVGKILELQKSKLQVGESERQIYSGVMADETGKILCTFWDVEPPINKTIIIRGAYVNTFRRLPQLVADSRCEIISSEIEISPPQNGSTVEISRLQDRGGVDVTVEGVIVKVKERSGLVGTCPKCMKLIKENYCDLDGTVEAKYELRIWCIVDDGSGSALAVLDNAQSESISGMKLEECLEIARKALSTAVVDKIIRERVFGIPIKLRGNALISEKYGLIIIPREVKPIEIDEIERRVGELLSEVKE